MSNEVIVYSEVPVRECPKLMYNGPCGGGSSNLCEVTRGKCAWIELYLRDPDNEIFRKVVLDKGFKIKDYIPKPRKPSSKLMEKISSDKPVLTYEFVMNLNVDIQSISNNMIKLSKVYDALNFIDTPLGLPHADPLSLAIIAKNMGIEVVVQVSCKDKNRSFLEAIILSLMINDIRNILAITGDWPHLAGDKNIKPVFDLDATRLVYLIRLLSDLGIDYARRKIRGKRIIHVGVAVNPYFEPLNLEIARTRRKYLAGAEFLETQPIFDPNVLKRFVKELKKAHVDLPIIASIIYLDNLELIPLLEDFARVKVMDSYVNMLRQGNEKVIEYLWRLADELLSIEGVSGIHVLTMGNTNVALKLGSELRRVVS